MEHFDHTNGKSIFGSICTVLFSYLWHVTRDDLMFGMACISFCVTLGYTIHKWYLLIKNKNNG